MNFPGNILGFASFVGGRPGIWQSIGQNSSGQQDMCYDPELLYVECEQCRRPVLWEAGKTSAIIAAAGIDACSLDDRCMIVSYGCPSCSGKANREFALSIVRLAGLTPEEAVFMEQDAGHA